MLSISMLVIAAAHACSAASAPEQIHLALSYTPESMTVSWTTQDSSASDVLFSTSSSNLSSHAAGTQSSYNVSQVPRASTGGFQRYTSPFIHHVTLTGLKPATKYYYQCGDSVAGVMSPTASFTTMPAVGTPELVFSLIGDLGQTADSSLTVDHVLEDATSNVILHVGDMSYADCDGSRWDSYFKLIEPLAKQAPWMVVAGNHEIEPSGDGTIMAAYKHRYKLPQVQPGVDNTHYFQETSNDGYDCTPSAFTGAYDFGNSFYSLDIGPAHVLFLNSYVGTNASSAQFQWLLQDLKSVNRDVTPWIIALFHSPWYSSSTNHYAEFNEVAMRASMEATFHKYGVSAVFNGHVHAYERTHPVFDNATTDGAATYFVIGDGGNREGHAGAYMPTPAWSAYRDNKSYGHGRLAVANATHAKWEWHRNEDKEWVVTDDVWIVNKPMLRLREQHSGQ